MRLDVSALTAVVAALAGGLRAAGVRRGDVVAWQAPNWWEVVVLYRACWRLGAVAGPIHHLAGPTDVERMLAILQPKVFLPTGDVRGTSARLSALVEGGEPVRDSAARPSDIGVVLFTSGSTGGPKAALHTQRGLAYKARVMVDAHQLCPDDSVLMPAPLAHISGLLNAVLLPGVLPMRAQVMPRWEPDAAVDVIARERSDVHDRAADLLRRAHGRGVVLARPRREPAARVERRSRRHALFRRRGHRAARCRGQADVRVDRGADDHDEHAARQRRARVARPMDGRPVRRGCA